ncbi:hypothetical protein Ancab_034737 [Ancistrocladus abbreviatus]
MTGSLAIYLLASSMLLKVKAKQVHEILEGISRVGIGRSYAILVCNLCLGRRTGSSYRTIEFARILHHTPSMGSINSAVRIQVDRATVSVWAAKEGMLLDSHEILKGCKEGFPLASVSRSYVEDSLISKSLTGYRSSEVKLVDNCQTENQSGGRSSPADLLVTLQKGYGEPDDGDEGENCSPVIIPDSGSKKQGIGAPVGLAPAAQSL